jgi:hypothetical protein
MKQQSLLLFIALLLSSLSYAQETEVDRIDTDRPGLGESSQVLPHKRLQIEIGGNYEFDKSTGAGIVNKYQNIDFNNTIIRYGLFERVEVRLGFNFSQSIWRSSSSIASLTGRTAVGFTPWSVGFKAQISDSKGAIPQIAIEGNLEIPYPAAAAFKTDYVATNFIIPFKWTLHDAISMSVNLGAYWNGDSPAPDYFSSFGFDASLPANLGAFVEAYMFVSEDGAFQPGFNAGVVWQALPNLQFDFSAGVGLTKEAPNGFLNGGISFFIPN